MPSLYQSAASLGDEFPQWAAGTQSSCMKWLQGLLMLLTLRGKVPCTHEREIVAFFLSCAQSGDTAGKDHAIPVGCHANEIFLLETLTLSLYSLWSKAHSVTVILKRSGVQKEFLRYTFDFWSLVISSKSFNLQSVPLIFSLQTQCVHNGVHLPKYRLL